MTEPTIQTAVRLRPSLRPRLLAYCRRHGVSLNAAMNDTMDSGLAADEATHATEGPHDR